MVIAESTHTADGIPYGVLTLITERGGPMPVEPLKLVEEASRGEGFIQELKDGRFRVRAKAQHCGVTNRNNRVYPLPVWEQHLVDGCPFQLRIGGRGVIGHLEHPDDGKSKMPLAAIVVTEAAPPNENGEIWITFETLSTPPGRVVEAYTRDRVRYGLSSRGNGSVRNKHGVDEVQEDFEPITWDCVIDESTPGAEVSASEGLREALAGLDSYLTRLNERAEGNPDKAATLLAEDTRQAVASILEEEDAELPSGFSHYLMGWEDGSAHYRAYEGPSGWAVWIHPHNEPARKLVAGCPELPAAKAVADNHYRMVVKGTAMRAQKFANRAIPAGAPKHIDAPNISGMGAMMQRHSGKEAPGPVTDKPPRVRLSFENAHQQGGHVSATSLPRDGGKVANEVTTALSAIQKAGMVTRHRAEGIQVFSSIDNAKQATAPTRAGTRAEADVSLREYAPDKSAPGSMAGGNTVPDEPEEVGGGPSSKTNSTISDKPTLEDPEDLDLDLDVNEADAIDYDFMGEKAGGRIGGYDYMGEMGHEDGEYADDDDDDMEEMGHEDGEYADDDSMGDMEYETYESDDEEDDEYADENVIGTAYEGATMFDKALTQESKDSRMFNRTFARRMVEGNVDVGAVRVFFNESRKPVSYEFYSQEGFLESVTDATGRVLHSALAEGNSLKFDPTTEKWIGEDRKAYSPVKIIRKGLKLVKESLPGRHGGDTGVETKNMEYMGKKGPEYSMPDLNDPGDRGQDGDAQKPGDYDKASEEGDGEHVQKGTWPESKHSDEYVNNLREKNAYLESEIARYEDQVQEQHEALSGLREAARNAELERARAEAYETYPELRQVESNLMRCESVEELHEQISTMMSLVETVRSDPTPAPDPAPEPVLAASGVSSGAPQSGVPQGALNESSSSFSDRLGAGVRLGSGDVVSRVAAHRKRRRRQ